MEIDNALGLSVPALVAVIVGCWVTFSWVISDLAIRIPKRMLTEWRQQAAEALGMSSSDKRLHDESTPSKLSFTDMILIAVLVTAILVSTLLLKKTSFEALSCMVLLMATLLLLMIDIRHYLLPDIIVLPAIWAGLLVHVIANDNLRSYILGAAAGYAVLYTVWLLAKWVTNRSVIGHGDMKAMSLLGAWFGVERLVDAYLLLAIAVIIGMVVAAVRQGNRAQPTAPYYFVIALAMTFDLRIV